jgi:beta-glucosidase
MIRDIDLLVSEMTLEEKASLCSGADLWHTKKVARLDIDAIKVSDGPHGLRTQSDKGDNLGINESIEAVCFPPAALAACSFDRELIRREGEIIGNEAMAYNVSTVLGPAVNMKRSPLCGRNFEYYSEDPYLCGELASEFVKGVQSKKVGTSLKHFAVNNQETYRMSNDSVVDERTLREIYLYAFEKTVKEAKPTTLMSSYNKLNGTYTSENKWLLNDVLRDEWGFEGLVMSDWNAVNDRPLGVAAGLDLEMPSSNGANDREIVKAVQEGRLSEDDLDVTVKRILKAVQFYYDNKYETTVDLDRDHDYSLQMAENSMVLLKNEKNVLPLSTEEEILYIGEFFEQPRFQGGGSSHINSHKVVSAKETMDRLGRRYTYFKGFSARGDYLFEEDLKQIFEAAKKASKVVVFAGLPESFESEGYDRAHMDLPSVQNKLITELMTFNSNIVVVLHNGSPVTMPWNGDVKGILESYLGGEAAGEAVVNILYGKVNPSGKLAESFPVHLEGNPSYLNFGEREKTIYSEGIFIGYRYYDKRKMEVLYPFGHGLSYTEFKYSGLRANDPYHVSVEVTNIGGRAGAEVVQLYISDNTGKVNRPVRELKGFEKVFLAPGETKNIIFSLDDRSYEYFDEEIHDWYAYSGKYTIAVGSSSRDIREEVQVIYEGHGAKKLKLDLNTPIGKILENEEIRKKAQDLIDVVKDVYGIVDGEMDEANLKNLKMQEAMLQVTPLRNVYMFGGISREKLLNRIEEINKECYYKS